MRDLWRPLNQTLFVLLGFFVFQACSDSKTRETELVMYCAAGIKAPVTHLAKQYEEETGVKIRLQFGGSGTLLTNLQIAPSDIYLSADSSFVDEAKQLGLVENTYPVALLKAGLGVPAGNPKRISTINDLTRDRTRVGIGNPEAASIGRFTKEILSQHDAWDNLKPTVTFPTVNELANAIKLNTVDVVILWDAVAAQYPEVDFLPIPELDRKRRDVTVAVISSSRHMTEANAFCRYLISPENGQPIFRQEGYEIP